MSTPYHMRRQDREITDRDEIHRLLLAGRYATLALVDEGRPYAVTLSYGFDPESMILYFHVAHEGRKLDIIGREPRACASIVIDHGYTQGECEHPFESVVMDGVMRQVTDAQEKQLAIRTLVEHLEADSEGYWDSRAWELGDRINGFTALAFKIESITAKRGK